MENLQVGAFSLKVYLIFMCFDVKHGTGVHTSFLLAGDVTVQEPMAGGDGGSRGKQAANLDQVVFPLVCRCGRFWLEGC